MVPDSVTYFLYADKKFVKEIVLTKNRCRFKGAKLYSRLGWVSYAMNHRGKILYEVYRQFPQKS